MYNRYIAGAWPEGSRADADAQSSSAPLPQAESALPQSPAVPMGFEAVSAEPEPPEKARGLSALKGLFGGNIKLPEFNADTILLLVLVYFLVADDSENINDTLLIIGVLLLLGF